LVSIKKRILILSGSVKNYLFDIRTFQTIKGKETTIDTSVPLKLIVERATSLL